ncbi:MAG: manganese efflux pump [Candidatus Fermentithermobacillus carboniphilus]|uniref:Manganese efflux pump n=1 Tax=Candidatus Fermentithermobacillus carboniphilus TaxID=3085328 RepID=A0AAT9LAY0_9FIRM|nr:MAG: manganese efflux pump [Candidatus Fermentithermobacillus carboniphilus]
MKPGSVCERFSRDTTSSGAEIPFEVAGSDQNCREGTNSVVFDWHAIILSAAMTLAVSMDGVLVGAAFSIRGLALSVESYWLIGMCTAIMVTVSIVIGRFISVWLPLRLTRALGAGTLSGFGAWQLGQALLARMSRRKTSRGEGSICTATRDETFGGGTIRTETIRDILEEPILADRDLSGTVDARESVFLGIALGLDALAAGLGASMAGFSLAIIPLVALASPLFVHLGILLGRRFGSKVPEKDGLIPGILLVLIGLLKFLRI